MVGERKSTLWRGPLGLDCCCLLLATLLTCSGVAQAQGGEGWNWYVTPYIWATETKYKLKLDGSLVEEGKVTFDDLMDTTEASFQAVIEVAPGDARWSVFADVTYFDASDTDRDDQLRIDSDSELWLVDAAVAWWPRGEAGGLSLFGGLRYTDIDDTYEFRLANDGPLLGAVENKRDFVDALVGVRYRLSLSERWALLTRADYSVGDSEGIWQAQAVFRYGLGKSRQHGLMLGYRYKEATFEYDNLEEDNKYYGPLIGFQFKF